MGDSLGFAHRFTGDLSEDRKLILRRHLLLMKLSLLFKKRLRQANVSEGNFTLIYFFLELGEFPQKLHG